MVDPAASTFEQTKNENLGQITLKTSDQSVALFKAEDATCPISGYQLLNKDGSVITSTSELYTVLGMSTRSTNEIKFDTSFIPANKVIERAVEFQLIAYNNPPKKIQTGKTCVEYQTKRISVNTDVEYTVQTCNAKCFGTTGCVQF